MTRKREHDDGRVNTSFRIPRDLLDEIDALCDERMVGRSFLIERLLRRGLEHLPPVEPGIGRELVREAARAAKAVRPIHEGRERG